MVNTYDIVYVNGRPEMVGEVVGSGGEAIVYKLGRRRTLKVYRRPAPEELARDVERAMALELDPEVKRVAALPQAVALESPEGDVVGIVERYVRGKCVRDLYAEGALTLEQRLYVALQLADALRILHRKGVVGGDLSLRNVMYDINHVSQSVVLVDADGFLYPGSERERELKFSPGYATRRLLRAAQHINRGDAISYRDLRHTAHTDDFSMAVMAFELLMCASPYQGVAKDGVSSRSADENELRGFFPYYQHDSTQTAPPTAQSLSSVPMPIRLAFIWSFSVAAEHERLCIPSSAWVALLSRAYRRLPRTCERGHRYLSGRHCPLCDAEARASELEDSPRDALERMANEDARRHRFEASCALAALSLSVGVHVLLPGVCQEASALFREFVPLMSRPAGTLLLLAGVAPAATACLGCVAAELIVAMNCASRGINEGYQPLHAAGAVLSGLVGSFVGVQVALLVLDALLRLALTLAASPVVILTLFANV